MRKNICYYLRELIFPKQNYPTLRTQPQNNWNYYLILPLYALAFSQFALITADNDLWGHIKFGEELWNQQLYPTTNIYSYTAPDHTWINHEWLAELIVYLIYNLFLK